jgi:SAM-dependent methyltransferase
MLVRSSASSPARRAWIALTQLLNGLRTWCANPSVMLPFAAGYLLSRMVADLTSPALSQLPVELSKKASSYGLALEPRDTKPHQTCNPPLECAWSLDSVRTQHPSLLLYSKATSSGNKDKGNPPQQGMIRGGGGNNQWDEKHYDQMSDWYHKADPAFLKSTRIMHFGSSLPSHIHVIPINGETYFRRSLRDADMIMDGFVRSVEGSNDNNDDGQPHEGEDWLDFGGSHGRITQILAAAYPESVWHVCDPIAETVQWAQQKLPHLHFASMDQKPPLSYVNETFAGIYALSIWSHYSEEAALVWFEEMGRILKKGGRLWFSTHGYQALNFGMLDRAVLHAYKQQESMFRDLYLKGHFYFPMFGTVGDWGVKDGTTDGSWWGYGAFTAEWLAAKVLNHANGGRHRWRLEYYGPGINERHQDAYVLIKL